MVKVQLGAAVNFGTIWWWLNAQAEKTPSFHAVCVIPGTFVSDDDDDVCGWPIGAATTWSDYDVERDKATVVLPDEWPDEVCAAIALYAMGIEGED